MSERRKHEFVWDGRKERGDDARLSIVSGRAASDLQLKGLHLRILLHLGRFNHKKGWCRLSQADLAALWGATRQRVNMALNKLVERDYIEKRDQRESGESFCLYRVILDSSESVAEAEGGVSPKPDTPPVKKRRGGVSPKPDTPPGGGVSPTGDRSVTSRDTPVSPTGDTPHSIPRAHLHVGHVDKKETNHAQATPKPVEFVEGAGDRLIPFSSTDPRELVADVLASRATGKRDDAPLPSERSREWRKDGPRLPFSAEVIGQIRRLCLDIEALIERYHAKAAERARKGLPPIKRPSAYLMRMAQDEVAQRNGVSVATVAAMAGKDRAKSAAAVAAELDLQAMRKNPPKVRASAELVASLASGKGRRKCPA